MSPFSTRGGGRFSKLFLKRKVIEGDVAPTVCTASCLAFACNSADFFFAEKNAECFPKSGTCIVLRENEITRDSAANSYQLACSRISDVVEIFMGENNMIGSWAPPLRLRKLPLSKK